MADSITNTSLKKLQDLYNGGNIEGFKSELIQSRENLSDGLFHYNLGTAFAKEGQLAAARYNFERALKTGYEHPALHKNLKIIRGQLNIATQHEDLNFNTYMTKTFVYNSDALFMCVSLVFVIFFALMYRFKVIYNKWIILGLILVSFAPVALKKFYFNQRFMTGINLSATKVLEGPSEIYPIIQELSAGQKIILSKSYDKWIFVIYPADFTGWVERSKLGIL